MIVLKCTHWEHFHSARAALSFLCTISAKRTLPEEKMNLRKHNAVSTRAGAVKQFSIISIIISNALVWHPGSAVAIAVDYLLQSVTKSANVFSDFREWDGVPYLLCTADSLDSVHWI